MNYTDAEIADALRRQSRNMRGLAVGLRCAFMDARGEGWSAGWAAHAVRVSTRAMHDFAAFHADRAELDSRGGRDGRLMVAWNTARRTLFESKMPPPDNMGGVWRPFSEALQERLGEYSALALEAGQKSRAVTDCLKPEYAYWTRQHGQLGHYVRLLDRMDRRMTALAEQVDMMGPAGRIAFLQFFTPDMRRAEMVPP